jgi:hypothetical protein
MTQLWVDAYLIGSKQFSADHSRRSSCGAADGVQQLSQLMSSLHQIAMVLSPSPLISSQYLITMGTSRDHGG